MNSALDFTPWLWRLFVLSSWAEFLKCLTVEFIRALFVSTKPQVAVVVFVNREQRNLLGAILNRITSYLVAIIPPNAGAVGSHPQDPLPVFDDGHEVNVIIPIWGFQLVNPFFSLVFDKAFSQVRRVFRIDTVAISSITDPECPLFVFKNGANTKRTTTFDFS